MDWSCKAVITAITVALLLGAARWLGRRIAGVLAGLPTITGPALVWLAQEHGVPYAIEAAVGSVAACALCAAFAFAYERISRTRGVVMTVAMAIGTTVLLAAPVRWLASEFVPALLVAAMLTLAVHAAMPSLHAPGSRARLQGEVVLTALVSGTVSGAVSLCAPAVGPFWAGVLASPPLIAAAVAMHQHACADHASVVHFLRGYVGGLVGRAAFGAGFALLALPLGIAGAAVLAVVAGCGLTAVVTNWQARTRVPG